MRLIWLAVVLGLSLTHAPIPAWSQTARTYRVAMLEPFATEEGRLYRAAFLAALRELGYVEGRNLILHLRTSDRDRTLVPTLADELIALKPDVLVSDSNAVRILRQKTASIPIVLTASGPEPGAPRLKRHRSCAAARPVVRKAHRVDARDSSSTDRGRDARGPHQRRLQSCGKLGATSIPNCRCSLC